MDPKRNSRRWHRLAMCVVLGAVVFSSACSSRRQIGSTGVYFSEKRYGALRRSISVGVLPNALTSIEFPKVPATTGVSRRFQVRGVPFGRTGGEAILLFGRDHQVRNALEHEDEKFAVVIRVLDLNGKSISEDALEWDGDRSVARLKNAKTGLATLMDYDVEIAVAKGMSRSGAWLELKINGWWYEPRKL